MQVPTPSQLLDVWEAGLKQPTLSRAVSLLAAAFPDAAARQLAHLSIGQRNGLLLDLHEYFFGRKLACIVRCPNCTEQLEFELDLADLGAEPPKVAEPLSLTSGAYDVRFRLPDSDDLLAVADETDAGAGRMRLLERCLVAVTRDGDQKRADELPPEIIDAICTEMEHADPQGNLECGLSCPSCSHAWGAAFDIAAILWSELHEWAVRTLRQVHTLALAYGWSESEILSMGLQRRQMYIEMIGL